MEAADSKLGPLIYNMHFGEPRERVAINSRHCLAGERLEAATWPAS